MRILLSPGMLLEHPLDTRPALPLLLLLAPRHSSTLQLLPRPGPGRLPANTATSLTTMIIDSDAIAPAPSDKIVEPLLLSTNHASTAFAAVSSTHGRQDSASLRQLPAVVPPISIPQLLRNAVSRTHSLQRVVCDAADSFVTSFLTPLSEANDTLDPHVLLRGICAPVDETPPTQCRVIRGTVPSELIGGAYLRNGPNVTSMHEGEGYHFFDGDGMLHSVAFNGFSDSAATQKDSRATASSSDSQPIYCSRFVQTSRFRQEKEAGRPLMVKVLGGMRGVGGVARAAVAVLRWMLGIFDLREGFGLSNTNVCFFDGQILSLSDDDLPYVVRLTDDGDLITTTRFRLPSKYNMSAHPKIDRLTGDLYAFSLNFPFFPPFLPAFSFLRLSPDGSKSRDVPVPLPDVPLLHDFAITPRFIVFSDHQVVMKPWKVIQGAMPMECEAGKTPRICLLPRDIAAEDVRMPSPALWFDAPGINCLHILNSWEEGSEEVVVVAPVLSPPDRILDLTFSSTLSEIRLNITTGKVSIRALYSPYECDDVELGIINPNYAGKKSRYVYIATGNFPDLTGIVKVDLSRRNEASGGAIVGMKDFASEGLYGGEPCFVPAKEAVSEDHGYLLCIVGDKKSGVSHLLIMDARSPSLEVISAVELPSRVPPGFHGCFVTAEQLAEQRN